MATNGKPRLGTPVTPVTPTIASQINRNVPPKPSQPPSIPPPAPVIPVSLLQPNEQRLLITSFFGLLEVSWLNPDNCWSEKLMIGIQSMGYPCTLLHESRTNLVKFTSLSWPNYSSSLDDIRAPPDSLGRLLTYTPIIPFVNDTEYTTNRWTASCMECRLLGREHAWGCV
jgi:hypothetical protein